MAKKEKKNKSELVFLPLGGVGEIGMNLYLYGVGEPWKRDWIMLDLGITFPHEHEPGVDVIMPDIRFIEEERDRLKGIVLTHAHEDHFGAVIDLWPDLQVPVYATPFTAGLLKAKLVEQGMENEIPVNVVPLKGKLSLGPFDLELVTMTHSIPEPNGVIIKTEFGTVFHTGDWKLDPTPLIGEATDVERLKTLGNEGVDVLVCDSTNALRDGTSMSEDDVARGLEEVIGNAKARVAVTTFASNLARLYSIHQAAHKAGRHVVVVGRAMRRIIQVARETGYLPDEAEFLGEDEYGYLPPDKVLALCTGSQGESRAAIARIASGSHPKITLNRGDLVVFSARAIPGNEKSISEIQNKFADKGVDVITDAEADVHVSGHPRRGELKELYSWLKPAAAIPMHGEPRHLLAHCELAEELGVTPVQNVRNGHIVRLMPGPPEIIDEAPVGRIFRDGRLLLDYDDPIRDRRRLSFAGIVCVSIVLGKNGDLLSDPAIAMIGVPEEDAREKLIEDRIFDEVTGVIDSIPRARKKDMDLVAEAVRRAVRSLVNNIWGKKPACQVLVHRVS